MSKAILAKRQAEVEQRKRDEDAAIRAYFAKIPDDRPSDGRSGAAWGGKFTFGKGDGGKRQ